ncbi:MAG: hypothetical protein WA445_11185 [Pseudolabrys sp.]|jgi:hypothetical protein
MPSKYVRFDEVEDVLSSLGLLALCAPLVREEPSYWKWAIISAHAALQGAMVCALHDTSGLSVLDKQSARGMREWFDKKIETPPNEKLAHFNTLLRRCCESKSMRGEPLALSQAQLKDIKLLHDHFRNSFAHFVPQSWSIEKAGLPRIVGAAVDVTERLMAYPNVVHKLSGNKKRRFESYLGTIRTQLG